jgi:uncharacterized protein YcbK (DUF882 family)
MKHFTIQELTVTNTGLPNIPNDEQKANLTLLVDNTLDPVRELIDAPITVDSGFRSPEVNAKVGGTKNSQHLTGQAADIVCFDNEKLFNLIKDNLPFDQLINEYNFKWIHVSYSNIHNRKQILVIT